MRPAYTALISCVIGLTFSASPVFIASTSVLLIPISIQTGWMRADVAGLLSICLLSMAVAAPLVGRLVSIFGARPVIILSTIAFSASLACMSIVPSVGWALVCAGLAGLFGTGAGQASYLTVLPLWFGRRFGFSLAVAMLGVGAGNAMMPIFAEHLLRVFDWRQTYLIVSALLLVVALPSALFLLRVPVREVDSRAAMPIDEDGATVREALHTGAFWQLVICFFMASTVTAGIGVNLAPLLIDRGYTAAHAAEMFSVFGVSLLAGRFVSGILFDHFSARLVGVICLTAASIGAGLLAVGFGGPLSAIAVVLIALAHGMEGDLTPFLTRRYFGLRAYSTIYGIFGFVFGMGTVLGSLLMNASLKVSGSYNPMLWASVGIIGLAALALAGMRPAKPQGRKFSVAQPSTTDVFTSNIHPISTIRSAKP